MRLVAIKHISAQRPRGTVFEETGMRARMLVAIKAAKAAPDEKSAPASQPSPPVPTPPPPTPPAPEPVTPTPRTPRRGRSFPIGPHDA